MRKLLRSTLSIGICLTLILLPALVLFPREVMAAGTINPQVTYTVQFDSMAGSPVESQIVAANALVTKPVNPTRSLYVFAGWFKDRAYTTDWNFATDHVTSTLTLYAKWLKQTLDGLSAKSLSYNSINLTWTPATGANGYLIYRATGSAGSFGYYGRTTASSFTDTGLTTNTMYRYRVRAYSTLGTGKVLANLSAIVSIMPVLSIPSQVKAISVSYNSIYISWQAVAGASGYQISRATAGTGPYTLYKTLTGTSWTNTGLTTGTHYYYRVRAYRRVGLSTYYSKFSSFIAVQPVPAVPTSVLATSVNSTTLKISWTAVTGATGYDIVRSISLAGPYSAINSTTATSCADSGLTTGETYYYKVLAYRMVDTSKVTGGYSSPASAKPLPMKLTGLRTSQPSPTSIILYWKADPGAAGYRVYRSSTVTGSYQMLANVKAAQYTDSGLTTGKVYYYSVRAFYVVDDVTYDGPLSDILGVEVFP
jgi:uncharacterized repeat protein (TIGR02543 family)